ncbi:MAG: chemotaxis response regulator protein-glutamate methylesterase [Rhodobacteraceae bacterium]|nr:chemotaxis response regulator protein-glutamate methylesterase [Paracoccaceae bacterium]
MVVDDSLVIRGLIARTINETNGEIQCVAMAANGQAAVERAKKGDIDVVILDIEMPVMDGITALPKLLAIDRNMVIIMASTLTTRNADISLKALAAGAKDYLPKPTTTTAGSGFEEFRADLIGKVRELGTRYRRRPALRSGVAAPLPRAEASKPATAIQLRAKSPSRPRILAIGASTGGPNALQVVLKDLGGKISVPVVITQHMPPTFTTLLAANLSRETGLQCAEAKNGDLLEPNKVYIAPGDFHMMFANSGGQTSIRLDQGPKENHCRPAVDVMLRSVVDVYKGGVLCVILTGMGQDGWLGGEEVVKAGGNVIAQDEATSVVWGMPGKTARAGICCAVKPLNAIGQEIRGMIG